MIRNYYANGKLLLSGEYLVLYGAKALVVPLKVGQDMRVIATGYDAGAVIRWQANVLKQPWFSAMISPETWNIIQTTDYEIAGKLVQLLREAGKMNHHLFTPGTGYDIFTNTGFDMNWGLGSSSSLIANIAQWAVIDPFELNFRTSSGSGADIAASISAGPVLYKLNVNKPEYYRVNFKPAFSNHIWMVYLGHKQQTTQSIHDFLVHCGSVKKEIAIVDHLSLEMIQTDSLETFMKLIREHEKVLSGIVGMPAIGESRFQDFPGEIKSLGAWGGDFAMAVSEEEEHGVLAYFEKKGMHPVFSFDKIVL